MRDTPGAESYGPEAHEAEVQRCAEDGIPAPSAEEWEESSRAAGWTPLDPLHADLLAYERFRIRLGDVVIEGTSGPVLEWPTEWGAWSLASHRDAICHHWRELDRIQDEERGR